MLIQLLLDGEERNAHKREKSTISKTQTKNKTNWTTWRNGAIIKRSFII